MQMSMPSLRASTAGCWLTTAFTALALAHNSLRASEWMSAPLSPVARGQALQSLLSKLGMLQWAGVLAELGAVEIEDVVHYVKEVDLADKGMPQVPRRKLKQVAATQAAAAPAHSMSLEAIVSDSSSSAGPWIGRLAGCVPTVVAAEVIAGGVGASGRRRCIVVDNRGATTHAAEAAKLVQAAHDAQSAASTVLAAAVSLRCPERVHTALVYALGCVQSSPGSPEMAAKALTAASRALASCPLHHLNHSAVKLAETHARDYFIWRTQLRAPLGDRG